MWAVKCKISLCLFGSKTKFQFHLFCSAICRQAHIKLEVVFFMYLWSVDLDAVVTSLSCFGLLCEEAEIRCGSDDYILPNYHLYQELAQASSTISTPNSESRFCYYEHAQGRVTLQKTIMSLLRRIEHCVNGVQPAWEETFRNWEIISKLLQSYPKGKSEEGQANEMFHRTMVKRRASHQSSEHDLEEQITEWANMTWFLLALGGACLQKPRSHRIIGQSTVSLGSLLQQSTTSLSSSASSGRGSLHPSTSSLVTSIGPSTQLDVQYCPVTQ